MKPLVSVVMSAFNADSYINRSIESILLQTLKNFELIVVNNASSDKTLSIIRSYARKDKRIRIINNKQSLKFSHSLNIGVSFAKADLIARMDADDASDPKRLEAQYLFLKKHPKVAIVGTNIIVVDTNGVKIWQRRYPAESKAIKGIMLRYAPFAHPTVMFRKKVFEEFGGYNPKMRLCEDIDFWFRIGTKYDFGNISINLLRYTLSKTSSTHYNLRRQELASFQVKLKAIFEYGYRPSLYDIIYNLLQFLSMWFMPANFRIKFYNMIRSGGII